MEIIVEMEKTKETKNTIRYDAQEDTAYVSSIYVSKFAFVNEQTRPEKVKVTVQVLDS